MNSNYLLSFILVYSFSISTLAGTEEIIGPSNKCSPLSTINSFAKDCQNISANSSPSTMSKSPCTDAKIVYIKTQTEQGPDSDEVINDRIKRFSNLKITNIRDDSDIKAAKIRESDWLYYGSSMASPFTEKIAKKLMSNGRRRPHSLSKKDEFSIFEHSGDSNQSNFFATTLLFDAALEFSKGDRATQKQKNVSFIHVYKIKTAQTLNLYQLNGFKSEQEVVVFERLAGNEIAGVIAISSIDKEPITIFINDNISIEDKTTFLQKWKDEICKKNLLPSSDRREEINQMSNEQNKNYEQLIKNEFYVENAIEAAKTFSAEQIAIALKLKTKMGFNSNQAFEATKNFSAEQMAIAIKLKTKIGFNSNQSFEVAKNFNPEQVEAAVKLKDKGGFDTSVAIDKAKVLSTKQVEAAIKLRKEGGFDTYEAIKESKELSSEQVEAAIKLRKEGGLNTYEAIKGSKELSPEQVESAIKLRKEGGFDTYEAIRGSKELSPEQVESAIKLKNELGFYPFNAIEESKKNQK